MTTGEHGESGPDERARVWVYQRTPRIELRQLRAFLAVAEELNFTRAAKHLGIAQPPLSQQIKALEHQLKVELFIRDKRQVELTREGAALVTFARQLTNTTLLATETVQAVARGEQGPLAIGSIFSAIYSVIPRILPEFVRRNPGVTLHLQEMTVSQQITALQDGSIDLGLVRGPVDEPNLEAVTLFDDPFIAVVPAEHELAGRESLTLTEVAAWPLIRVLPSANRDFSRRMFGALTDQGFKLNVVQAVSDTHTLLGLVAAGFGVSLVPESIRALGLNSLRYIPLSDSITTTPVQIIRRRSGAIPSTENFLKLAKTFYPHSDN